MNTYTTLPLNAETLILYIKQLSTLGSWTAIIILGLALWKHTGHKGWTLLSVGYAITLFNILISYFKMGLLPFPYKMLADPGPPIVSGNLVIWDITGVFVALGLGWVFWSMKKHKSVEQTVAGYDPHVVAWQWSFPATIVYSWAVGRA